MDTYIGIGPVDRARFNNIRNTSPNLILNSDRDGSLDNASGIVQGPLGVFRTPFKLGNEQLSAFLLGNNFNLVTMERRIPNAHSRV